MLLDLSPLKVSRDYRLLFFGQLVSFFGSMMTFIVVPWQMYQLTRSSFYVGLLGVVESQCAPAWTLLRAPALLHSRANFWAYGPRQLK